MPVSVTSVRGPKSLSDETRRRAVRGASSPATYSTSTVQLVGKPLQSLASSRQIEPPSETLPLLNTSLSLRGTNRLTNSTPSGALTLKLCVAEPFVTDVAGLERGRGRRDDRGNGGLRPGGRRRPRQRGEKQTRPEGGVPEYVVHGHRRGLGRFLPRTLVPAPEDGQFVIRLGSRIRDDSVARNARNHSLSGPEREPGPITELRYPPPTRQGCPSRTGAIEIPTAPSSPARHRRSPFRDVPDRSGSPCGRRDRRRERITAPTAAPAPRAG